MKNYIKNNILLILLAIIPVVSLIIGFVTNEDLSTGGAKYDFNLTWPIIVEYSNFNFLGIDGHIPTVHMPLHYGLLSLVYTISNDQYQVRLFYLFFSLLLPAFLYLNLIKIYNQNKLLLIVFSLSFLFIPLLRASAIWSNSHLTATIFVLIGNYFYLKSREKNIFFYKVLNLLFLSFAIYSLQTYLILFIYYLYNYFSSEKLNNFIKLFLFSALMGVPGLLFIILNPRVAEVGVYITRDFFYTISTNFSIIFLFLFFMIFNKENLTIFLNEIKVLRKKEIILISFLCIFTFYNQELFISNIKLGGGFFYKLSYFIFNNNLIFITSFLLGLFTTYILVKYDPRFLVIFIMINLMNLNYVIYQKYFEPLFLIIVIILYKNFLISNVLLNFKNILIFYGLIFLYFIIAYINYLNKFSYQLLS
tara:strand:- start:76 stop:1332 length:1257 start_codon:yes stop_codon:yes gene_type:complete